MKNLPMTDIDEEMARSIRNVLDDGEVKKSRFWLIEAIILISCAWWLL